MPCSPHKFTTYKSPGPVMNSTQIQPTGGPEDFADHAKGKVIEGFLHVRVLATKKKIAQKRHLIL